MKIFFRVSALYQVAAKRALLIGRNPPAWRTFRIQSATVISGGLRKNQGKSRERSLF